MSPTRQAFKTAAMLKLEVGRRPSGIRNGVPNPRGELGTWAWTTPVAGSDLNSANGQRTYVPGAGELLLGAFTVGGVPPAQVLAISAPTPAVAGRYYAARANLLAGSAATSKISLALRFYDSAGNFLGASLATSPARNTTQYVGAIIAPAGTATHALAVTAHTDAAVLAPGAWASYTQAMTAEGTTAAIADANVGVYREPWEYVDVLSPTTRIDVKRAAMQPGTLSAVIYDAALDPAAADALIRPGVPVRLRAIKADASFAPLFTGEIDRPTTDYDPVQVDPNHKVRITLNATDRLSHLANVPAPNGVAHVAHLSAYFEGSLIPWNLNNDPNGEAVDVPVVSRNARASLLDQVLITRDTRRAHAYVDAYGSVTVIDPATMPAPGVIARALTQTDFTAPIVAFDPGACVNYLTVKALQAPVDTIADSDVLVFGPYGDPASRDRWGTYHSEATVHGLTVAEVNAYAAALLASNATPTRRVTSLTLPMWEATDVHNKAHLELTDRVTITSAAASLTAAHARIVGIHHQIEPDKWLIKHEYADPTSVPLPASVTAPTAPVTTALGVDTAWADFPFANGWKNWDAAAWGATQYCRRNGIVYFRGLMDSRSATSDVMGYLPAGFRPGGSGTNTLYPATYDQSMRLAYITGATGAVVAYTPGRGATYWSLAGLSYPAAQ